MKKTFILLADGFEEIEALTVVDILRRCGIVCDICSIDGFEVAGSHRILVVADMLLGEMDFNSYDAIILPGGMPGARNLKLDKRVIGLVKEFYNTGKLVAAICAAPIVLKEAGITDGKTLTSYPDYKSEFKNSDYTDKNVVQDGNIITSRGPSTAMDFAFKIAGNIVEPDIVKKVKSGMLYDV